MAELFYMRCWVGMVGCIAVFKALHGYSQESYAAKKIYTLKPAQAGPLFNRMFGNWILLAGVVRFVFALSAPTLSLYLVTLFSFILAFVHFAIEVWVTKTAPLAFPTASPLLIAGGSGLWMIWSLPGMMS